jgi:hypothetical protein
LVSAWFLHKIRADGRNDFPDAVPPSRDDEELALA